MNAEIQSVLTGFLEGAFETIAIQVAILGALGIALSVLLILVFKIAANSLLGEVTGKWLGTWRAVWILCMMTVPAAGFTIGAGEGFIRGCEKALRESEFGRKTVPVLADQSVYLYAAVYYADPASLKSGKLSDLTALGKLNEVREFANGNGELDAERLNSRMQDLSAARLTQIARNARDDFARLTPALGDDFKGIKEASEIVMEYAVSAPDVEGLDSEMSGPLFDIESAATLRGDPSTVTRDELSEHLRERVAIPGLMMPIRILVRPWQIGATVIIGLLLLLLALTRFSTTRSEETS